MRSYVCIWHGALQVQKKPRCVSPGCMLNVGKQPTERASATIRETERVPMNLKGLTHDLVRYCIIYSYNNIHHFDLDSVRYIHHRARRLTSIKVYRRHA